MNKQQIELYEIKKKELREADKCYIRGFKAAMDYLVERHSPDIDQDLLKMDSGYRSVFRMLKRGFFDNIEEALIDRMFYEIDACIEYYQETDPEIPDEDE